MNSWKEYQTLHQDRFLEELLELLRIPSVSARTENKAHMHTCAELVQKRLREAGADRVEIFQTPGHPIVFAEKLIVPSRATVLVYGHYDVQPADPLDLWTTPPFEPTIRDGKIFARGACDDKGQFYMHVKALEIMAATGTLPVNIKFLIEGEEEVGSSHLADFVKSNKSLLQADVILISDTSMLSIDTPSIDVG
ncbi:MAG: M20/M25/M40 family metallo-hydrolase, partial [Sediminibacterium sp.]